MNFVSDIQALNLFNFCLLYIFIWGFLSVFWASIKCFKEYRKNKEIFTLAFGAINLAALTFFIGYPTLMVIFGGTGG